MKHALRRLIPALAAAVLCGWWGPAAAQDTLAVKGGRLLTMAGAPVDHGVVLMRNGKIVAVGADVAIPVEAKVLDATGKVVMPGFVDVHSAGALTEANDNNPNVPFLSAVDGIDPSREFFEECRRDGVTTVAVVPGNETMIGGQAAIIKTAGRYVNDMLVRRDAGIKLSLKPVGNRSRMSHYAALRKELERARTGAAPMAAAAENAADQGEKGSSPSRPAGPPGAPGAGPTATVEQDAARLAALGRLLRGELPAWIYCDNAMDVHQALALIGQYHLKAILVLGTDCDKAVSQIAAAKPPVVLPPTLVFWRKEDRTGDEQKIILPELFHHAGIPFALETSNARGPTLGNNYLWYQAAIAVKYGVPIDEALRSVTLLPAKMLGVDSLVGSLEPNKDADLVILTGDPLRVDTWVDTTVIAGKVVYRRADDAQLRELLEPPANQ